MYLANFLEIFLYARLCDICADCDEFKMKTFSVTPEPYIRLATYDTGVTENE